MSRWAAAQVAAALLLLASMPLPAASQDAAIAEVPEACKMVHIEDYKNDLPTVMGNGSTTDASCPDDASICSLACKQAIQRLDADCVAYVRGPDWLTKMLTTCKMQLHEVNPCAAKNVTVQSQQQYGPNLKSCPVLANQTCSCNADFSCVRALYELGSRCAKYLGFSYGPFTPTDTEWTDLYAKCNMSIGDFERGFVPPCSSGASSAVTVAAVAAGAVAGIVVGVVLVLAAMVGGYMCYRRRQQRKSLLAQGPSKGYPSGMMITTGAACPSDGWTATGGFAAAGSASRGAPAARAPAPLYSVPPSAAHSGGAADPGQCTGRDHDSAQSLHNDPLHQFLKAKRLVFPGGSQAAALPTAGASRDTATSSVAVSSQHSGSTAGTAATAVATPSRRSMAGVSVQPWEIAYQDLLLLEECGEGSFGRVYRAQWHEAEVAAKVLLTEGSSKRRAASIPTQALAKLEAEASLLASLRHPNVVSFYGICRDPPCIITEYCANGSLTDTLAAAREAPPVAALLTWPRRLAMALDAAKGMLYLHNRSPPIIHRDLKSPNLLVDRHMTIKVTDFNLSRILEDEGASQTSSMAVMNPRWLAPEVMQGLHATPAADVFSFGVVLWELLTWQMPFADMRNLNNWQLATLVVRGQRLEIPPRDELPGADTPSFQGLEDYVALLQRCWAAEPADRPSFQHVVQKLRALLDQSTAVHSASIAGSAASRGRQGAAVCTSGSGSL